MRRRANATAAPRSSSLIGDGVEFDAIFAASDVAAIGAMHALQQAGRGVPEMSRSSGFDDIPAASLASPPLTTVTQDAHGAAEALIETIDRSRSRPARPRIRSFRCRLTVREFERRRVEVTLARAASDLLSRVRDRTR